MKVFGFLLLTCVLAAGCDEETTTPSTPNTISFTSTLLTSNETTPVTNAEQSGRGTSLITFNLTRDAAGAIQSGTVDFRFDVNSFPANTTLILAHIHTGASSVAGPVLIDTGLTPATALVLPSGSGSWEVRGVASASAATLQSIIDNPGGFYFNVHSSTNQPGVVRGQLVRQ